MLEVCERFFLLLFLPPFQGDSLLKVEKCYATLSCLSIYYSNLSQKLFLGRFIIPLVLMPWQVTTSDGNSDSWKIKPPSPDKDLSVYFQKVILHEFQKCVIQRCLQQLVARKKFQEADSFSISNCVGLQVEILLALRNLSHSPEPYVLETSHHLPSEVHKGRERIQSDGAKTH